MNERVRCYQHSLAHPFEKPVIPLQYPICIGACNYWVSMFNHTLESRLFQRARKGQFLLWKRGNHSFMHLQKNGILYHLSLLREADRAKLLPRNFVCGLCNGRGVRNLLQEP